MNTYLRRTAVAVAALLLNAALSAAAQSPSIRAEIDVTGGYSTEEAVKAAATQIRILGETKGRIRFNVESAWADQSGEESDAFGSGYPYGGRVQLSEGYGQRVFMPKSALVAVRVGQYRSPFGISSSSDTAYAGFLRAPLVRYDGYWTVANNFRERGIDVVAGTPRLSAEISVGVPSDIGIDRRRKGTDVVVRVQSYFKNFIVGASHMRSQPFRPATYARGRMEFNGVDARWMLGGVQVRGEWLSGQPWNGPQTEGWYVDATVHRPFMGVVTAVFRAESLDYNSPRSFRWREHNYTVWQGERGTLGSRIRLPGNFTAHINLVRQNGALSEHGTRTALDAALTYSLRIED